MRYTLPTLWKSIPLFFAGIILATSAFALPSFASPEVTPTPSDTSGLMANASDPFGVNTGIRPEAARDETNLQTAVVSIINYLLLFMGLVLLVIIIWAGFQIIVSNGDEEKLTKGRQIIIYALIGVVIIVLSYTLVNFIANVAFGGDAPQ